MDAIKNMAELRQMLAVETGLCRDVECLTGTLGIDNGGKLTVTQGDQVQTYPMNDWAFTQLCAKLNMPVKYMRKCPPELQAHNTNFWSGHDDNIAKGSLVRLRRAPEDVICTDREVGEDILNGTEYVRGLLSQQYSVYNNERFAEVIDKIAFKEYGSDIKIEKSWHSDKSFHIRVLFPEMKSFVRGGGDTVLGGLHFANSEVGFRRVSVDVLVYQEICTNGLIGLQRGQSWFEHVHRGMDSVEMDQVIMNICREGAGQIQGIFKRLKELDKMDAIPEKDLEQAVDVMGSGLPSEILDTVKVKLVKSEKRNNYDLLSAFTETARDLGADDRLKMEHIVSHRMRVAA